MPPRKSNSLGLKKVVVAKTQVDLKPSADPKPSAAARLAASPIAAQKLKKRSKSLTDIIIGMKKAIHESQKHSEKLMGNLLKEIDQIEVAVGVVKSEAVADAAAVKKDHKTELKAS